MAEWNPLVWGYHGGEIAFKSRGRQGRPARVWKTLAIEKNGLGKAGVQQERITQVRPVRGEEEGTEKVGAEKAGRQGAVDG
jgi:hypothetical protein